MLFLRARTGLLATVAALALAASPAWAADSFKQRVNDLTKAVDTLDSQARTLDASIAPGRGILSREMATLRFQDAVYDFMLGDYERAGEAFFSLVASGVLTDAGLHSDSEWYLAESLFRMGNASTAEGQYQAIATNRNHPFREDAVRRLLELYAVTGQTELFYEVYRSEILSGKVAPSPLVSYTVAKAFYTQGELEKAREQFARIPAESEWYGRGRYFLGTIDVAKESYETALPYFVEVSDLPPQTVDDRKVQDLALLAVGRLNYELGRYDDASSAYIRIGGDSEYLADKLYEQVWVHVKQERWAEALRSVEVFLLGFPEHEYTARLKLLEGHLHLQQEQYEPALVSYEDVISDYTPVRDRFADLASTLDDPERYFQRVLEISRGELSADGALPAYAVAMMLADDELARSLSVYEDLVRQEEVIAGSDKLIAEIEEALTRSESVGGFGEIGYQASTNQYMVLQTELDVLFLEEEWLIKNSPNKRMAEEIEPLVIQRQSIGERLAAQGGAGGSTSEGEEQPKPKSWTAEERVRIELTTEVKALQARAESLIDKSTNPSVAPELQAEAALELEEVEAELTEKGEALTEAGGPLEGDLGNPGGGGSIARSSSGGWAIELSRELQELRKSYEPYRPAGDTGQAALMIARFDGMYTTLEHNTEVYAEILDRVATAQSDEMAKIRERFDFEIGQVAKQKADIAATKTEVESVAVDLTREGFARLEDFFSEALLGADVGIVDVFWAEKLQTAERRERLAEERNELIEELESRFSLIRSKLGEERN
ncbi:MAG: tetratricopeptide repeat protein [Deltaproteobacteria bacterium]|nr:MAG: tetratricopeptide repeat protein [Deltaproteobacteria bacterium]